MKLFSNYFLQGEALTGMLRCQMDDNKRVIKKIRVPQESVN